MKLGGYMPMFLEPELVDKLRPLAEAENTQVEYFVKNRLWRIVDEAQPVHPCEAYKIKLRRRTVFCLIAFVMCLMLVTLWAFATFSVKVSLLCLLVGIMIGVVGIWYSIRIEKYLVRKKFPG